MSFSNRDISEFAIKSAGELFCGSALFLFKHREYNDEDKATDTQSLQEGRSCVFKTICRLQVAGRRVREVGVAN